MAYHSNRFWWNNKTFFFPVRLYCRELPSISYFQDINDNSFKEVKSLQLFSSKTFQIWNQMHLNPYGAFTALKIQPNRWFRRKSRFPHLESPVVCWCLVDWTLMAPRWLDRRGEFLGDGLGEILGGERGEDSWGQGRAAGGLNVGFFLGMRLRRWLTQRCCSSAELVNSSSSLALDMS